MSAAAPRDGGSRHNQVARALINALSSRADLEVEKEPYYYYIPVVAVNKDSGKEDAYATLSEAAAEKRRKYSALGAFFTPLILSVGGLMEKETARAFKGFQKLLGPAIAELLSQELGTLLAKARASSISKGF